MNKNLYTVIAALICGTVFGFSLSKARATDFNTIQNMFLLRDFQLYGVIAVAVALVMSAIFLIQRYRLRTVTGEHIRITPKPWINKGTLWGSALFGMGWAVSGGCPGTFLAMIGEGKTLAFVTVAGILTGTYLQGRIIDTRSESTAVIDADQVQFKIVDKKIKKKSLT